MMISRHNRNLPCWIRYVLQVWKMISETSSMHLWDGIFFTLEYIYTPKSMPKIQTKNPQYSNLL